jgi:hypothetical protein
MKKYFHTLHDIVTKHKKTCFDRLLCFMLTYCVKAYPSSGFCSVYSMFDGPTHLYPAVEYFVFSIQILKY